MRVWRFRHKILGNKLSSARDVDRKERGMKKLSWAQASMLMVTVVVARSIAYTFSKTALLELPPLCLLATRFLLAFGVLAVLFRHKLAGARFREIFHGCILGALLSGVMFLEMLSLPMTDTTVVSFLENTATVLVPLLAFVLFKEQLGAKTLLAMGLAAVGVALLTLSGGQASFSAGEAFALGAAVLYAAFTLATGRFSRGGDPFVLGIVELGAAGAICLAASCALEAPMLPERPETWGCLAVLVLVCSVFGFTFQPVAQKFISSDQAAFSLALSPVSATLVGVLFLGERLSLAQTCGAALVLAALVLCVLSKRPRGRSVSKAIAEG